MWNGTKQSSESAGPVGWQPTIIGVGPGGVGPEGLGPEELGPGSAGTGGLATGGLASRGADLAETPWAASLARRYHLLQQIEETERATVWLAEELGQGRVVWLEVLSEEMAADQQEVNLFYEEATAAAGLHHPHILRAEAAEMLGPTHFRVVEQLRGGMTLRQLLMQEGWLEPGRAGQIALQILNALTYAHQRGVWHLALQPECVWFDANGEVVLGGFGIAADTALEWAGRLRAAKGRPACLAPEQIAGQPGDARSDLYALGALLYEMLTDRVPFDSNDREYLQQRQRVQTPQPPLNYRPELPSALSALVMSLLARAPEQRTQAFPDTESLSTALRQACESPSGRTHTGAARPTNPLPLTELSSAVAAAELLLQRDEMAAAVAPVWQPEPITRAWLPSVAQGPSRGVRWTLAGLGLLLLLSAGWWWGRNGGTPPPTAGNSTAPQTLGEPAQTAKRAHDQAASAEAPASTHVVPAPAAPRPTNARSVAPEAAPSAASPSAATTSEGPTEPGTRAAAPPPLSVPPLSRPRTVAEINAALAASQPPPKLPEAVPGNTDKRVTLPAPATDASASGKKAARSPIQFGAPLKRSDTRIPAGTLPAVAGIVAVKVTVNERGAVTNARAVAGPKALYARAETAARQWRFQPSTRAGVPLPVVRQINFDFRPAEPRRQRRR